jgi:ABC-type spermidine/putrescine transport system permease subunit I
LLDGVGVVIWLMPLFWWSMAAVWGIRVFTVRRYRYFSNSPDSTRKAIERIGRRKAEHLYWAVGFWAAGVLTTLCALIYTLNGTN